MVSRILTRKLLRDVRSRKVAFIALVAVVAVGVGIFVCMASVYLDLDGARDRYYRRYRLADFSVRLKRAPVTSVQSVETLPNVIEARGRVRLDVLIHLDGASDSIQGIAVSTPERNNSPIYGILLYSGTWFSSEDAQEVVLDQQFAAAHNLRPGDRIKVLLVDRQHDLLVVGTAMSPEFVMLIPPAGGLAPDPARYGVLYLPLKFLQDSGDLDGAYNEIVGMARDTSRQALADTLQLVKEELDPYGVTYATQFRDESSVGVLRDELASLKTIASILPVIFLGVAALVLNIMISRLVAQQRSVIGTFRALGLSRWTIIIHYLGFGVIVGTGGVLAGLALGTWLQGAMIKQYQVFFAIPDIERHIHPDIIASGVFISLAFALLGTLKSSLRASRLEPAVAMHPPPPERGGKILLERAGIVWRELSFGWKLILRSVFRNPFRSLVSISASAVATALLLASLSNYDGLIYLMNYHFDKLAHEDYSIALREPRGARVLREVKVLPTVSVEEPQLVVACDLKNGPFAKRTPVTGLPPNNRLYTPLNNLGRELAIPNRGIILTRKLAEILQARQGDVISMRPLIGRREKVRVPVLQVIDSYLGLSAYCDLRYLSALLGEEWVANSVLATTFQGSHSPLLMQELQRRPLVIGVSERERSLHRMDETIGGFMKSFIVVMVLFAGIIAFGSIFNTALVSLSERQREVGTLRVLGYTPVQVTRIFSGESFLLNMVGVGIGLVLGAGLAYLLAAAYNTELYRFPAVIYGSRVAMVAVAMVILVGLAQGIIYLVIRGLDWLDVLKVKE
jgi:putative ABC transport system permease protein